MTRSHIVLGFYRVATWPTENSVSESDSFNPVLGFYRVATLHAVEQYAAEQQVSIPFWVSTASRLNDEAVLHAVNNVSIPFWVSTASRRGKIGQVFRNFMFQSRSGFLPRRDGAVHRQRPW